MKTEKKLKKRLVPEVRERLDASPAVKPGSHIVRWVAVVDVLDEDGVRALVTLTSEDMEQWEYDGLVANAQSPWEDTRMWGF